MIKYWAELVGLVSEKPWIYRYLSDEVKETKKITEMALKASGDMLEFAPDKFKSDRELVLIAVETGDAFLHASEELQHDKEIILKALEWDSFIIEDLDEVFYEDLDIMYKAVEMDAENYTYFLEEMQEDKEIALACIKRNCETYCFLSDELKKDEELVKEAVARGISLGDLSENIKNYKDIVGNKKIVLQAIKLHNGDQIAYASDALKCDYEIITYALEHELSSLEYLNPESLMDKAILKTFFKKAALWKDTSEIVKNVFAIPREIFLDDAVMLELIAENAYIFQAMYKDIFQKMCKRRLPVKEDVEFCKKAYQLNPKVLKFMGKDMKKQVVE